MVSSGSKDSSKRIVRDKIILEKQDMIPKVWEKEEQKNTLLQLPNMTVN
jgi:hypothetical protein